MNRIGIYLKKINIRLANRKNRELKEQGLTGSQMDVLLYLAEHGEQERTVSGIAQWFEVKHTSVIHVLKILEAKQLIEREPTREKNRARSIWLTEKAVRLHERNTEKLRVVDQCMLAGFSEEETHRLESYLQRIYTNLEYLNKSDKEEI